MALSNPVYICRYNYNNDSCQWLLTEDKLLAERLDHNYQLASLMDLLDWSAATGDTFTGIIQAREGMCKWVEHEHIDGYGFVEYEYCYKLI